MTPSLANPEMTLERLSHRRDKKTQVSAVEHKDDKTSVV